MGAVPGPEANLNRQSPARLASRGIALRPDSAGVVLALGGGFSRGFAHLGVLEVLQEESIRVAAIVGTSIGALLGAAYADGIPVRELCDLGRRVRVRDFLRFKAPGKDGQRKDCIGQFIKDWFRAKAVEELPLPTAIVTTDLDSGEPYVFATGPLETALRASCAFPGLVKPVPHEGRLLADGCIVAPVPTAIAARLNSGCVFGVSVGSNSANSFASQNVVKVFDAVFGASQQSELEPSWSRHADILLEPLVHHIDWNDFSRVDEAFAAGAEAARMALPALRDLLKRRARLALPPGIRSSTRRGLAL